MNDLLEMRAHAGAWAQCRCAESLPKWRRDPESEAPLSKRR